MRCILLRIKMVILHSFSLLYIWLVKYMVSKAAWLYTGINQAQNTRTVKVLSNSQDKKKIIAKKPVL